jgi:hypothetical protein
LLQRHLIFEIRLEDFIRRERAWPEMRRSERLRL